MKPKPIIETQPAAALDIRAIISKAIAVGRKPAGRLRREGILRILRKLDPDKRQRLTILNGYNTACWRMNENEGGQCHEIGVGSEFHTPCVDRIRGNARKLQRYCESLIRHEAAHGLFSDPDLAAINKACEQAGIPFRAFNLFEDARIEHLERERSRDSATGKPWWFHWWCFTATPRKTEHRGEYFWALVNNEASSWNRYSAGAPRWQGKAGVDVRIRDYYYHHAIHTARSADLIPLIQEWRAEFKLPPWIKDATSDQASHNPSTP